MTSSGYRPHISGGGNGCGCYLYIAIFIITILVFFGIVFGLFSYIKSIAPNEIDWPKTSNYKYIPPTTQQDKNLR